MSDDEHGLSVPEASKRIYDVLEPLDSAKRSQVISTILLWFPQEAPAQLVKRSERGLVGMMDQVLPGSGSTPPPTVAAQLPTRFEHVGKRAQHWLRRHAIADDVLERVFDMEGTMDIIAMVTGATKREANVNCYLMTGIRALLLSDEPKFTDAEAIEVCRRNGCYDMANHAHTRSTFANRIAGSKEAGFSLPAPGLEAAANVVKMLGV